jgi:hypothetical protein
MDKFLLTIKAGFFQMELLIDKSFSIPKNANAWGKSYAINNVDGQLCYWVYQECQ